MSRPCRFDRRAGLVAHEARAHGGEDFEETCVGLDGLESVAHRHRAARRDSQGVEMRGSAGVVLD